MTIPYRVARKITTDREASRRLAAQIAIVRARKNAGDRDDTYARYDREASAADDRHQRQKEGE